MNLPLEAHTILLVEDNEDDVFIFQRAYRRAQLSHPLQIVNDGQEAFDYFAGDGRFADRTQFPLPFLVFLDLKLPLKHGFEVLQAIRALPVSNSLGVVVLTSSAEQRDIARALELGAEAYLVKPPSPAMLVDAVAAIRQRMSRGADGQCLAIPGDLFDGAGRDGARASPAPPP